MAGAGPVNLSLNAHEKRVLVCAFFNLQTNSQGPKILFQQQPFSVNFIFCYFKGKAKRRNKLFCNFVVVQPLQKKNAKKGAKIIASPSTRVLMVCCRRQNTKQGQHLSRQNRLNSFKFMGLQYFLRLMFLSKHFLQ